MQAITEQDYVVLSAEGVGEQTGAILLNHLGTVGALHDAGDDGSIIINPGNFGSDITPVTTAVAILAERINGGPIRSDAALAIAFAQINGQELLIMAAAIKTFMDNPEIELPPGVPDTIALASDPDTLADYVEFLETNYPDEFNEAIEEIGENLGTGYTRAEVPGVLYAVFNDENPNFVDGSIYDLDENGNATVKGFGFGGDGTWVVDAEGDIVVDIVTPQTNEFFVFKDPPGAQVRALRFVDQIRIVRLVNGYTSDQVMVLKRTVTTYPDNPALPDEVFQDTASQFRIRYSFRPSGAIPLTLADIENNEYLLYYFHEGNEALGIYNAKIGADLLEFEPGGSGNTQRRNLPFSWSLDADGKLTVAFANGDTNNYVVYAGGGGVLQILAFGESGTTSETFGLGTEMVEADDASVLDSARMTNRKIRFLSSILADDGNDIDYIFLPGGIGCRLFADVPANPITWQILQGNILDLRRYTYTNTVDPRLRRSWQGIRTVPGILGDRLWTINTADFRPFIGGQEDYQDPTTNPGRLLAFEDIEDVTGQADPCNFGTFTSLELPFNSDNGGTGNMFDVTTDANSIEVTSLAVNVDLPVNTFFGITVYVANSSYEDTVTAPPGCIFGCTFDQAQWTQVATGFGFSAGQDFPSSVDIGDFVLPANSTSGIWVSLNPASSFVDQLRYSNGSQVISDGNITITTGGGVTGPIPPSIPATMTPDRSWNGIVYYNNQ